MDAGPSTFRMVDLTDPTDPSREKSLEQMEKQMLLILLMLAHDPSDLGVENAQEIATFHYMEDCEGSAYAINKTMDMEYAYCIYQTQ